MPPRKSTAPQPVQGHVSEPSFVKEFTEAFNTRVATSPDSVENVLSETWEITKEMASKDVVYADLHSDFMTFGVVPNSTETALQLFKVANPDEDVSEGLVLEVATNIERHGDTFYLIGEYFYAFDAFKNPRHEKITTGNIKLAELFYSINKLDLCPEEVFKTFTPSKKTSTSVSCLLPASAEFLIAKNGYRTRLDHVDLIKHNDVRVLLVKVHQYFLKFKNSLDFKQHSDDETTVTE